jgi:GT2 family glycosyltransferase
MKSKIAIVILNYMNYEDTIACVNCALDQTYTDYEIVIVENGSSNQSFNILSFVFGSCPKVTILRSKKNLGFARGNNLGIKYAKNKLKADYVFVCNSDILFEEDLFERIAGVDYKGIGVISPAVYNLNGEPQPPTIATDQIYKKAFITMINIFLQWINSPCTSLIYRFIKQKKSLLPKETAQEDKKVGKYILQGCSYFLTPEFFRYYSQLYPKTFLYLEEMNLLVYLQKVRLSSIMIETSPVLHKGKGSTYQVYRTQIDRKKLELCTSSILRSLPMFFMNYPMIRKRYHSLRN